jgi:hypothetical protein
VKNTLRSGNIRKQYIAVKFVQLAPIALQKQQSQKK